MKDLYKDLDFNITTGALEKAKHGKGKRIIRGYASVGNVMDRQGEVITLEALEFAKNDLLKNFTIFREHHHSELPIGKVIDVVLDSKGLLITVEMTKASHADDIWQLIEEGILNSFSIGGRVLESQEKRMENGTIFNEITKIELFETSVVGIPANPEAKFELVSKSFARAIQEGIRKKEGKGNMSEQKEELKVPDAEGKVITKIEAPIVEETKESDASVEKSEVLETVEETIKETIPEVVEEVTEEAIDDKPKVEGSLEKSEEVEKTKTEESKVEKVEDQEEVSTPDSDVVEEEQVVEKSTDEKILEMLVKMAGYLEAKQVEEKQATKSEESVEEAKEEAKVVEETKEDEVFETAKEEVTTDIESEIVSIKDKEDTVQEVNELVEKKVEIKKVTEVLETSKECEEEVAVEELKKSGMIITEPPYAEETNEIELINEEQTKRDLKKLKDIGWTKLIYGLK